MKNSTAPRKVLRNPAIAETPTDLMKAIAKKDVHAIRALVTDKSMLNKRFGGVDALGCAVAGWSSAKSTASVKETKYYEAVIQCLLNAGIALAHEDLPAVAHSQSGDVPECLRKAMAEATARGDFIPFLKEPAGNGQILNMGSGKYARAAERARALEEAKQVEEPVKAEPTRMEILSKIAGLRKRYAHAKTEGRAVPMLAAELEDFYQLAPGTLRNGQGELPLSKRAQRQVKTHGQISLETANGGSVGRRVAILRGQFHYQHGMTGTVEPAVLVPLATYYKTTPQALLEQGLPKTRAELRFIARQTLPQRLETAVQTGTTNGGLIRAGLRTITADHMRGVTSSLVLVAALERYYSLPVDQLIETVPLPRDEVMAYPSPFEDGTTSPHGNHEQPKQQGTAERRGAISLGGTLDPTRPTAGFGFGNASRLGRLGSRGTNRSPQIPTTGGQVGAWVSP